MSETNRQIVLAKRPEGKPDPDTFRLEETDVPDPRHGEVVVRTLYLSVDPYMRGRMDDRESYADPWEVDEPMRGGVVGEVVASEHERWEAGDTVRGTLYWSDYARADGDDLVAVKADADNVTLSAHLGVLGMPGQTAYFGVRDVAEVGPGDTLVVTGAAGAVGSVAGQIGKLAGARVVGFAGSEEKVRHIEEDLGFDAGIDYTETEDYGAALDEAAPGGVDAYFDNVGGPITDAVFTRLNLDARVAVCGQISVYNETSVPTGPRKLPQLIGKRARVEGFLYWDYAPRHDVAAARLSEWVASGEIDYRETVVDGLEDAPDAFLGLFEGENVGKQVVKVAEPSE